MPNYQFMTNLLRPGVAASSIDVTHPPQSVVNHLHPFDSYKSADSNAPFLYLFFGGSISLGGIFVDNVNFGSLACHYSVNGGASWVQLFTGLAVPLDARDNRRHVAHIPTSPPTCNAVRLTPSSLVAGESAYEFGEVATCLAASVLTMPSNPEWPLRYVVRQEESRIDRPGGVEVNEMGRPYLDLFVQNDAFTLATEATLHSLLSVPGVVGSPIVLMQNDDFAEHAYMVQILDDVEFREEYSLLGASMIFRESAG